MPWSNAFLSNRLLTDASHLQIVHCAPPGRKRQLVVKTASQTHVQHVPGIGAGPVRRAAAESSARGGAVEGIVRPHPDSLRRAPAVKVDRSSMSLMFWTYSARLVGFTTPEAVREYRRGGGHGVSTAGREGQEASRGAP